MTTKELIEALEQMNPFDEVWVTVETNKGIWLYSIEFVQSGETDEGDAITEIRPAKPEVFKNKMNRN